MVYSIDFHPEAVAEFDAAIAWYQEQRAGLEQTFFDDYLMLEDRLVENPFQFPTVFETIRRANFPLFPYSIFFEIEQDSIFIYAIFHQSRDPEEWAKRV